jgi:hypothetical protein
MQKQNSVTGYNVLRDPRLNKGTAFTEAERRARGIECLLPPGTSTLILQVARVHMELANLPAMGMAVFATEATRVTQEMFIVAAKAVAEQVAEESLATGLIYPPQSRILEASLHVAGRIAEYIFDKQLARVPRPDDIQAHIRACAYRPVYSE